MSNGELSGNTLKSPWGVLMSKWEYAYLVADLTKVDVWFATPDGNTAYSADVPEGQPFAVHTVKLQQIAKLGDEGWEIFNVTDQYGLYNSRNSTEYHFRRPKEGRT